MKLTVCALSLLSLAAGPLALVGHAQAATEIGGEKIVTLTRASVSTTKPEFTSIVLAPGRAMEPSCCWVRITTELVRGVVALGRISRFSGVKLQDDWSGKPEQESVTNMGDVRPPLFSGVMDATTVPDWPGVREIEAGATEIWKSGVALAWARTPLNSETERMCDSSPV